VIDRFLTGLRSQGPGAIPALILSLAALGATAYWLLSRDHGQSTQTSEVVSAPSPLAPATAGAAAPSAPKGSDSGSGSGSDSGRPSDPGSGDGKDGDRPAGTAASGDLGGDQGAAPRADHGGSESGGRRSSGQGARRLEAATRRLLRGNSNERQGSTIPGVDELLQSGSSSADQAPSAASIEDLLEEIENQK
jgi:hypothetical protein